MIVEAWKIGESEQYIIRLGDDIYEMNRDAHLPNGVCNYLEEWDEVAFMPTGYAKVAAIPLGIAQQIATLAYVAGQERGRRQGRHQGVID